MIPAALLANTAALRLGAIVVVGVALLGAGFYGGKRWSAADLEKERAQHATVVAAAATARAEAVDRALADSRAAVAEAERIAGEARAEEDRLRIARAAAVTESGRLRDAAATYQRRHAAACAPGATSGGTTGAVPGRVYDGDRFLRVLGELDGAAGAFAEAADRARSSGLACERTYEVMRAACGSRP
jgi:hypothetical protein